MKLPLLLCIVITCASLQAYSQGCSDAGFCSVGNLASTIKAGSEKNKNQLKLALTLGVGDESVFVFTPALEYNRIINDRWSVQAKVTGNYADGSLGSAFGAGDFFLSGTYSLNTGKPWRYSITAGTKLPFNQSTLTKDGRSLPMQYQSSLGTVDLITGVAVSSDKWQFNIGLQQPVSGINRNHFLPQVWNSPEASKFPPTNDFDRKGDMLLRAAYTFNRFGKFSVNAGLLGIYHLGNDTYIDANIQNQPIPLVGSKGLTLNATGFIQYTVNNNVNIGLTVGVPIQVRDIRPDGLTRSFVVSPQIIYSF